MIKKMVSSFLLKCRNLEKNLALICKGGSIAQWLAPLLLVDPAILCLFPRNSKKNSEEKIVDVVEVNHQRCLEESGQLLESVD